MALSWCFADESSPATDQVLARAAAERFLVPALWFSELANVLMMSERRGRLSSRQVTDQLRNFASLPFQVEPAGSQIVFGAVLDMARRERLTIYDATYLELAQRHRVALASLDQDLCAAAARTAVPVIGPYRGNEASSSTR